MSSKLAGFFWFHGLFHNIDSPDPWVHTHAHMHGFSICVSVQFYKCHSVHVDVRRLFGSLFYPSILLKQGLCSAALCIPVRLALARIINATLTLSLLLS